MSNYLHSVSEFHETFGHPVLDEPQVPAAKRASLRVALLQEELDDAIDNEEYEKASQIRDEINRRFPNK
jgi:protein-arginine kinase activator protein McsA